jgi:hypothetical protein
MRTLMTMAAVTAVVGCSPAADYPKPAPKTSAADGTTSQAPVDPGTVSAQVSAPALMAASDGSSLQVPGFTVSRNLADYVEVLRCAKSFIPFAPGVGDARNLSKSSPTWRDNMRYAFAEAKAAYSECKIIGDHIVADSVRDLSSPSGQYYYIINPCVDQERTTKANVYCSYDLVFTPTIIYENKLSGEFIDAAGELARLEGMLSATMSRLYRHAEAMHQFRNTCDVEFFAATTNDRAMKAVAGIVTTGLAVGAGAVMGAGSAAVARQFLGVMQQVFLSAPPPGYQCAQFDQERAAGESDYGLLESQLTAVMEASKKLSEINAQYRKLDDSLLQYVRKPK